MNAWAELQNVLSVKFFFRFVISSLIRLAYRQEQVYFEIVFKGFKIKSLFA